VAYLFGVDALGSVEGLYQRSGLTDEQRVERGEFDDLRLDSGSTLPKGSIEH